MFYSLQLFPILHRNIKRYQFLNDTKKTSQEKRTAKSNIMSNRLDFILKSRTPNGRENGKTTLVNYTTSNHA